jgi:predicted AAA+ superfamily ATPase
MEDKIAILKTFNFWEGNTFELGFQRTEYTGKIFDYIGNRLVKVLVGQRRTGKSYVLRQIISKLIENGINPYNTLYINKEIIDFDFLSDYKSLEDIFRLYKSAVKPLGKIYLFIDEIQTIDGWERFVNSHSQDYSEACEIFITGSNSRLLSGDLATLLSGRYVNFQIFPFSFEEYVQIKNLEINKSAYLEYFKSGGLPELFGLPSSESCRQYVSAVKDTVFLRDIIQYYQIKDIKLLDDLFVFLINNASNLISIPNIVSYFLSKNRKINYETIANYIAYIENAFLIHKAERYNIKGKETLMGSCKYYANDHAFKNYLYFGYAGGMGYLLENLVYLTLIRKGYIVYTGQIKGKEVDFVAVKQDITLYLQCAYLLADEQIIAREYAALEAISDHYEKWVVSLDDVRFPSRNGIKHIQVWELDKIL